MVNAQNIVVTISKFGVTFLVPAIVWVTLMAGLLQFVSDGVRRLGVALPDLQRFARRSAR
jgi:hypothetical protein